MEEQSVFTIKGMLDTSLEGQINYMEVVNKVIKTPMSIAVLESLKELRANKEKNTKEYFNKTIDALRKQKKQGHEKE